MLAHAAQARLLLHAEFSFHREQQARSAAHPLCVQSLQWLLPPSPAASAPLCPAVHRSVKAQVPLARSVVLGAALGASMGIPIGLLQEKARVKSGVQGVRSHTVMLLLSKLTWEPFCPPASPLCLDFSRFPLPQIYDMLPEDQQVQRQRRVQHTEAVIAGTGADSMRAGLCVWSGTVGIGSSNSFEVTECE